VRAGDKDGARSLWNEALASMPADSPLKAYVERGLKSLE
jgi:predicted negative regulator of RcsB-dependent stress response